MIVTEFYERYLKEYENYFHGQLIISDRLEPSFPARSNILILEEALVTNDYVRAIDFILHNKYEQIQQFFEDKTRHQILTELVQKAEPLDTKDTKFGFLTKFYLESYDKYKFEKSDPDLRTIAKYVIPGYLESVSMIEKNFLPFTFNENFISWASYRSVAVCIEMLKLFVSEPYYPEYNGKLIRYIEKDERILELF
jgi:hypothetical protein